VKVPTGATERPEMFSDGVIAIAITLLGLQIRVPEVGDEGAMAASGNEGTTRESAPQGRILNSRPQHPRRGEARRQPTLV